MKITIYTTNDCEFSKKEKAYLSAHGQLFEEKNLESNKEYLTEMLAVSNNFAGTPVTKIEKDDGTTVILKGFTQEEFDKTLNVAPVTTSAPAAATASTDVPTATPPAAPAPTLAGQDVGQPSTTPPEPTPPTPPTPTPPTPEPTPPVVEPTPPTPSPVEPPKANDPKLASLLNDLQSMSAKIETPAPAASAQSEPPAQAPQPQQAAPATPPPGAPNLPNPNF